MQTIEKAAQQFSRCSKVTIFANCLARTPENIVSEKVGQGLGSNLATARLF